VLLGDAAHLVHPLAGQGLNLGLADVATLDAVLAEREPWRPVGDERLLRRYARRRAAPTRAMAQITDGLLHLFEHPTPLVRELRNRGLSLVNHLPSVKRWLGASARLG
jgi:2-polyprenyl-6-methoxyphenol hydroxylase-like FAD-dependent oxidoreductase